MPVSRVISGGQTGVDRAALDVARALGLPHGGWCPKGRQAEDGLIPPAYLLQETPRREYAQRTEWNVRDSDGTLVLSRGAPRSGTAQTVECARRLGKPCLVLDLDRVPETDVVHNWLKTEKIGVLNIAGPRESKSPRGMPGCATRSRRRIRRLLQASLWSNTSVLAHEIDGILPQR